jgi:DNA-binding GntR family transcriptional regulator
MQKIPLKTLHQTVADRIYEMITKGELAMGQKLMEIELCKTLGVSRTPLREALRSLSSEGLVELIPNRGAFVRQPSIHEISDMFEAMAILEGICAKMAVEKMTEKDLNKLMELHQQLENSYEKGNINKYARVNLKYHTYVREAVKNETIADIVNGLRRKILMLRYRGLQLEGRFDASIKEHRDIIKAFQKKDPQAVEHFTKVHLINQCKALIEMYENK